MTASRVVDVVASGFSFLEAPRWHDGKFYASDFYTHRVLAFHQDGTHRTICEIPGQPSGLAFQPDGSLLVVSMIDRRILRVSRQSISVFANLTDLVPAHANDLYLDAREHGYVGNFGWLGDADTRIVPTCLVKFDRSGSSEIAAEDIVFPNGMVSVNGGRTLLVCETFASRITAFDRGRDGTLTNRREWAKLGDRYYASISDAVASGNPLPDGMTADTSGAVWIGDAGGSAALRISKYGEIVDRVDTGHLAVFAVALGGDDGRTLMMCASPPLLSHDPSTERRSCLLACRVDVPAARRGNP